MFVSNSLSKLGVATLLRATVVLFAPGSVVLGQADAQNDTAHVLAAAAEYAYSELAAHTVGLPDRVAVLDRRVLVPGASGARLPSSGGDHQGPLLAEVSEALGATVTSVSEVVRCGGVTRNCALHDATVLFTLGLPDIADKVARVPVASPTRSRLRLGS